MASLRLEPATLYPEAGGSVLVPLPLLPLPPALDFLGEAWERKAEMHVTAVSTGAVARRLQTARGLGEDAARAAAWDAIATAMEGARAGPVTVRDELRVVRRGGQRTLIAMAEVDGLAALHDRLAGIIGLPAQPPPAHVTLYTRPGGKGIGLHSPADLERLSRPVGAAGFPWPGP